MTKSLSKSSIASAALLLLVVITIPLFLTSCSKEPETVVEEVTELPEKLADMIIADAATAGFYTYEADNGTYVLMSYGSCAGLDMNVRYALEDDSVYFDAEAVSVADMTIHDEYRVYFTNATAISANETTLKNPGYGIGSVGLNTGWVEISEDNSFYITPIFDTKPIDRVFLTSGEARLGRGLYHYEYEIRSNGAFVTAAEKVDDIVCVVKVCDLNYEAHTADILLGDEEVRITTAIDALMEDELEAVKYAYENEKTLNVTLADYNGLLTLTPESIAVPPAIANEEG